MAFTVEDGTGLAAANAYISVAYFNTHHTDRGNSAALEYTTGQIESAIIRATDYIDKRFGRRFSGTRQNKSQALEWPRINAFDADGFLLSDVDEVPRQLEKACAEYALRALLCGVLAPDPLSPVPKQDLTDTNATRETDVVTGEVTRKREKVGPLEEETWYQTQSAVVGKNLAAGATSQKSSLVNDFSIPDYPEADMWLEELLRNSIVTRLVRGD